MPENAQNWGAARKALNVFMVQVFMNKYLAEQYGLDSFGAVLETPLDSLATKELRHRAGRGQLPRWEGIWQLSQEDSQRYQEFASQLAAEENIPRACLDIMLWRVDE